MSAAQAAADGPEAPDQAAAVAAGQVVAVAPDRVVAAAGRAAAGQVVAAEAEAAAIAATAPEDQVSQSARRRWPEGCGAAGFRAMRCSATARPHRAPALLSVCVAGLRRLRPRFAATS